MAETQTVFVHFYIIDKNLVNVFSELCHILTREHVSSELNRVREGRGYIIILLRGDELSIVFHRVGLIRLLEKVISSFFDFCRFC